MTQKTLDSKEAIKSIVRTAVESYATGFQARHEGEIENPNGVLNMKILTPDVNNGHEKFMLHPFFYKSFVHMRQEISSLIFPVCVV
ncbi:MAG: hypothetical protein WCJ49_06080, partial [Deltaproteobacteria bacterium]